MKPKPSEFPNLPERLSGLEEGWPTISGGSWHPGARMLFKMLDRQAWKESGHNPDRYAQRETPVEILEAAAGNQDYLRNYDVVLSQFRRYMAHTTCQYLNFVPDPNTYAVAYFSAEYGLHRSLPFYAGGGLGFLAGDHIKECSDLGVPLVAVGFMYPQGYLHQSIREDGWQEHIHETIDQNAASISRVFDDKGRQLVVRVPFIEPAIHVGIWKVPVWAGIPVLAGHGYRTK